VQRPHTSFYPNQLEYTADAFAVPYVKGAAADRAMSISGKMGEARHSIASQIVLPVQTEATIKWQTRLKVVYPGKRMRG
jgi:hypothetical protein